MKRKVIAFLRVSTEAQDTERQKADVARVIAANHLDVLRTLELIDVSGRTVLQNRDVQAMLKDLKRADVAGIAVSALDRLFRPNNFSDFSILDSFREAHKLIFSAKEGVLDSTTDAGFMMSLMSGAQAGMEWRELRRRTMGGKAEKRKLGRNVDGSMALPRGLGYQRITDPAGKTVDGKWFYEEPMVSQICKAYQLLFVGSNFSEIARATGWHLMRVRRTLENPVWKGIRCYSDGSEIKLPLEPLISPSRWAAAQRILAERRSCWRKQVHEPRFLASGVLTCSCGKKYYTHPDMRSGKYDTYYCASMFKGAANGCGAARLRRDRVDAAVERIVAERLADAKFLTRAFARVKQAPPPDVAKHEQELEKLASKRQRLIDAFSEGHITKEELGRRLDSVAKAVGEIEALAPSAAPPAVDVRRVIVGLRGSPHDSESFPSRPNGRS